MTGYDALALGVLTIVPLLLGFGTSRWQSFRWVLPAGAGPALYYWVEVALVDPSYDLSRTGQLLIPAFFALIGWIIWCGCAFAGRGLRKLAGLRRASVEV